MASRSSNNYNNNWEISNPKRKHNFSCTNKCKRNLRLFLLICVVFFSSLFFCYFDFAHHFVLYVLTLPHHKIEFSLLNNWWEPTEAQTDTHTHTQTCRRFAFLFLFSLFLIVVQFAFHAFQFVICSLLFSFILHPLRAVLSFWELKFIELCAVIKNQKCVFNHCLNWNCHRNPEVNQKKLIKCQSKYINCNVCVRIRTWLK